MKTDLRVRYTQAVIQEAFRKLLREKPLAKITVKEVCDLAQINRGTFYKHYLDCYDLMDKLQEEAIGNFERLLDSVETSGVRNVIVSILEALRSGAGAFELFRFQGRSDGFFHELVRCCYRCMEKRITGFPGMEQGEGDRKCSYPFLISGCCGVIEYWVHTGMQEPPEEIADEILRLSEAFLRGLDSRHSDKLRRDPDIHAG